MAVSPSTIKIDYARDNNLTDFALQTLKERYLIPGENSPQDAFARASAAFADDEAHAQRLYDYVSNLWFMFATPLLSNGGTDRGLPISCFLLPVEDSRQGIFDHWAEVGWLSSLGGGVGSYWGDLRSQGEKTSKGSASTGVIPFIAAEDRIILSVSQGGTRRGSEAAYLDINHPEIEEFITLRKSTGGDENRKALNLHNAVNITDEFMEAVRDDTDFNLVDPHSQVVKKVVKARNLWRLLIETRMQTGEPYFHFVDTSNRHLPATQKAKGLKVRQSNLCVVGSTELLTDKGYMPIEGLEGTSVSVWNGEEYSQVDVVKTGEQQEVIRVWFDDGGFIDCTPYHKFYDVMGRETRAANLKNGEELQYFRHPEIELKTDLKVKKEEAYVAGYATFGGFEDNNRLAVFVPNTYNDRVTKRLLTPSVDMATDEFGTIVRYEPKTINSGYTPLRWKAASRRAWFAGALDAVADWIDVDGVWWLSLGSTDEQTIREMRLAALELGFRPRVRMTDTMNAFMLNARDVSVLISEGLLLRHEAKPLDDLVGRSQIVVDVHPLPYRADTFCATEPKRNRLVFNGVQTGNCTEITLPTGRDDQGRKRTAVCCLSSLNADKYDEWRDHPMFIEDLMRMLDNCLDVFIRKAPEQIANAVYSATMERSVGLGLMGFTSYLQQHRIAYESDAARLINKAIFTHVRQKSDEASLKLGAARGEAPDMIGTGHRFAHRRAIAPNASSSILCGGVDPACELGRAMFFLHKTLSGSFPVRNRYLKAMLASIGQDTDEVWKSIAANEGSVQHLECLSDIDKAVFKTAIEVDQRWVIIHAADRQPDIDQAQSTNLFFPFDADAGYLSEVHFDAWRMGLKSLYYLRSTTPNRAENTNTKVERIKMTDAVEETLEDLAALAMGGPPVMEESACIACEG